MRTAVLLLAAAALLPAQRANRIERLVHNGLERRFHLHLPARASTPAPLVVVLHGGGRSADPVSQIRRATRFDEKAAEEGFAVVYPEALEGNWNDGRGVARYRSHADDVDDVGFIGAVVDRAASLVRIDRTRVYVAGASNGGMMAYRLACEDAARYAAVAGVIANLPSKLSCRPSRPVPVVMINGTDDPLMPWAGGYVRFGPQRLGQVMSGEASAGVFATASGCDPTASLERLPDRAPNDGTRVVRRSFRQCRADVVLYQVEGGGHTWPGRGAQTAGRAIVGRTSRDIDATDEIWAFFARQARR